MIDVQVTLPLLSHRVSKLVIWILKNGSI